MHKCAATFDYIKSLKNHMKIAQEVNNQNCVLCGSSFETKGELKSHISRIHEKITKKHWKLQVCLNLTKAVCSFSKLLWTYW